MRDDPEANADHPFADVLGVSASGKAEASKGSTDSSLGHGHMTIAQHAEVRERKDDARKMYAEGWTHRKGGWCADFGAPHTHVYGTGDVKAGDDGGSSSSAHSNGADGGGASSSSSSSAIPDNTVSLTEVVAAGRRKNKMK
jgi:hypothetical protein